MATQKLTKGFPTIYSPQRVAEKRHFTMLQIKVKHSSRDVCAIAELLVYSLLKGRI